MALEVKSMHIVFYTSSMCLCGEKKIWLFTSLELPLFDDFLQYLPGICLKFTGL